MATKKSEIKVGQHGFGRIGGYPPATWEFGGKVAGAWLLTNVKHPSQSTGYPPQYVDWATVVRIMSSEATR